MKPFGKQRAEEIMPETEATQKEIAAEVANRFAMFVGAESMAEALEEMKALEQEAEREEQPSAEQPAMRDNASETGNKLAQAYRALEGSMEEDKLDRLMESEEFSALIASDVPPIVAARCVLMDELLAAAEARGEKRGRTQVKNKLGRMNEVGTGMTGAFCTGIDPEKLSLKEIRDLKKRASRGETITI